MSEELQFIQKDTQKALKGSKDTNKDNILNEINKEEKKKDSYRFKWLVKDIIAVCFIILSIMSYLISLKGCNNTQTYCIVNLNPSFFYILALSLSFCAISVITILLMVLIHKLHYIHSIYLLFSYIYLLFYYSEGYNLSSHGSYNKALFFVLLLFYSIITLFGLSIIYLNKRKCFTILFLIAISKIFLITLISYKLRSRCNKWENGLNNQRIDNNKNLNKCYIIKPSKCWVNMLDGLLDVSWLIQEDCQNFRNGERKELLKYLPKRFEDTFNFGYPVTINYTWLNQSHFNNFFNTVLNDFIDLDKDDYYSNTNKLEILLKFNPITQLGKIEMNIQRNDRLVKERQSLYNALPEKNKPRYKNMLFVYIDALSRVHFLRKMKHTKDFLMKYLSETDTSMSVYQMMKYHSFIYNTPPNVNPMFYGESMHNANGTHIIRAFKEKGYITGQANNFCGRELYDIEKDYTKGMDFEAFDHENIALFCDPNFHNYENPFTPYLGPYSIRRRCLYGKDTFDYVFDYAKSFWETYKDERKFFRVAFQDAHEGTGEVVRYVDIRLRQFLDEFEQEGYLKDTAVFFVSDHGNTMIGLYEIFQVEEFVLEKTLASWYLLLPNTLNDKEHEAIKKNEQILTTPYDIHDTMVHLLGFELSSSYYSRYGQSIYNEIDGLSRNCKNYALDLKDLWCRCYDYN